VAGDNHPKRLRVLHVGKFYPPTRGGMETHLAELCTELQSRVDVSVIVANDNWRTVCSSVEGVSVTRVGTLGLVASSPVCAGMVSAMRRLPADIVHLHHPNPTAFLAYLLSRHNGRLVITYHSDIVRQKWLATAFDPLLRSVLQRSLAIIVTSLSLAAGSPVLSSLAERCHVIPFGIAAGKFAEADFAAVAKIRKCYGPKIVLSVGRLVYYKGFEYLIRAMKKVQGRLLLIGSGPLRPRLEREVQTLGLTERVHFLGTIPSLSPYYHAADVFVLPSVARSEAFGIVQLEAMASGKPVVNTVLSSGVSSVSLNGVTGLSVPPADPDALANAVNLLLNNRALNAQYGAAARKRVLQEFTLELMVNQTMQVYRDVMNSKAKARAASVNERSA